MSNRQPLCYLEKVDVPGGKRLQMNFVLSCPQDEIAWCERIKWSQLSSASFLHFIFFTSLLDKICDFCWPLESWRVMRYKRAPTWTKEYQREWLLDESQRTKCKRDLVWWRQIKGGATMSKFGKNATCAQKNIRLLLRDYCEEENAWNLSPSWQTN